MSVLWVKYAFFAFKWYIKLYLSQRKYWSSWKSQNFPIRKRTFWPQVCAVNNIVGVSSARGRNMKEQQLVITRQKSKEEVVSRLWTHNLAALLEISNRQNNFKHFRRYWPGPTLVVLMLGKAKPVMANTPHSFRREIFKPCFF